MQIIETDFAYNGAFKRRSSTRRAIIHHSASGDVSASTIHGWHLANGWLGIGYHFVLRHNGNIERGRPLWAVGSHAGPSGNVDSIGICLAGNFETDKPTPQQMNSLVWLLKEHLHFRHNNLDVVGHKDVMATACPGKHFPWAELRERLEESKVVYKTLQEVPDWGKAVVKKLVDRKSLQGDEKGNLNLSEDLVRILAVLDRERVFK